MLVDEFQDTNPLQNELLELLGRDNLFRVGDENQSIYRFRHADVACSASTAERAEADGRAESITVNFRSRGEVLDAIDLAFERTWGERFEPLREAPGAREPAPRRRRAWTCSWWTGRRAAGTTCSEREPDPFGEPMRARTAVAGRRGAAAGEAGRRAHARGPVVATATWSCCSAQRPRMGLFERALDERGIPAHVVGGRGYWGQQQVMDLRHWLAALANPLDELSVYSVLASPLEGLSLDGVALIGLRARRLGRDPGGR